MMPYAAFEVNLALGILIAVSSAVVANIIVKWCANRIRLWNAISAFWALVLPILYFVSSIGIMYLMQNSLLCGVILFTNSCFSFDLMLFIAAGEIKRGSC